MQVDVLLFKAARNRTSIIPVFLPFSGCPRICIFCAQHKQTGIGQNTSAATLQRLQSELELRCAAVASGKGPSSPVELGFFGGTFTAMPPAVLEACTDLVRKYRLSGLLATARCSTRPDCLSREGLEALREAGFSTVELGIQSFADAALTAARRGYSAACARKACALVREAGLKLVVQLLPGMPGVSPDIFVEDVKEALHAGAEGLRFYPCLVIAGTELARMWQEGRYRPWDLDSTLQALARGYALSQEARVPVIRMGLAPEKGFRANILAGPDHPALGSLVQGLALVQAVEKALKQAIETAPDALGGTLQAVQATVPGWCQGFFWGHRQSLAPFWQGLGLSPASITWDKDPGACLCRLEVIPRPAVAVAP